jgi:hypothetical protein
MILEETECKFMDLIRLVRDTVLWRDVVNTVISLQVPLMVEKISANYVTISFRRTLLHRISYYEQQDIRDKEMAYLTWYGLRTAPNQDCLR